MSVSMVVIGYYVEATRNDVSADATPRQRRPVAVSRVYTSRAAAEQFADLFRRSARHPHTVRIAEKYGLDDARL
jgi:hypothetical protein